MILCKLRIGRVGFLGPGPLAEMFVCQGLKMLSRGESSCGRVALVGMESLEDLICCARWGRYERLSHAGRVVSRLGLVGRD